MTETRTRTRALALLLALLTVFGTLWIPSVSAATAEATLTVTPEGGSTTTYSGSYQEMHQKLVKLAPTVKTEYMLVLNSDAAYTAVKSFNMNENVYLTIDLNGYTLDVSKVNSNIYTVTGSPHITIDGANDRGDMGTILNRGRAGGLFYVPNNTANTGFVGVVQNVYMLYTNMSQGYDVVDDPGNNEYPNQPMMHLNRGDVTMRNVHLTYTGEDATAVVGSEGSPEGDITALSPAMVTAYKNAKLTIEDCSFIDTNTRGIRTKGINASGTTVIRNTVVYAYDALPIGGTMEVYDSEFTGTNTVVSGGAYVSFYDCKLNSKGSAPIANHSRTVLCNGTVLTAENKITGTYSVQSGFSLADQTDGTKAVMPNSATEATLVVKKPATANAFYSGTYQAMHEKLVSLISASSTVDGYYELKLVKDSSYTKHRDIVSGYVDGATATVKIDYDGHDLLVKGNSNNIYTIYGTTTGYYNFYIDGADKNGNLGTLTCVDLAGGLVFTRGNNGLNANTTVEITNLNCIYTNMAQGIANESVYPNQPMLSLPAGKLATIRNLHMTYTGEDAVAAEGKQLTDLRPNFIQASGVEKVIIEDSSFIDVNTKGIKVTGLSASGNGKYYITNTEFKGFYGINSNAKHMELNDCKVTASYMTYAGAGVINVTDTVSVAGGGGDFSATSGSKVTFLYGEGKNTMYSTKGAINGTHTVQKGFSFVKGADGVFTMVPDTSVEASLAVITEGVQPTFTTGSYNVIHTSLNGIKPTVATKYVLTLTKDADYSLAKSITMNENATLVIDLDGHKLNASVHANLYQVYGGFRLIIDGANKAGERGMIYSNGRSGAIVYLQNKAGNNNDKAVVEIQNIELYYTNLTQGYSDGGQYPNQPMGNYPVGKATYTNVKMTYSGEDAVATEGSYTNEPLTSMYTTFISFSGSELTLNGCEFVDTNTKGITVRGVVLGGKTRLTVTDTKIDADLVIGGGTNNMITVSGGEFISDKQIFNGSTDTVMSDTIVRSTGKLTNGTGLIIRYGTGKGIFYTNDTEALSGTYTVSDDAILINRGGGCFTVEKRADEVAIYEGTCGDGINWKITGSGILKITGSGSIPDYAVAAAPWYQYADMITRVVIDNGITAIGKGAFAELDMLNMVILPESLKMIGSNAFGGCASMNELTVPDGVVGIGVGAFKNSALASVVLSVKEGWTAGSLDISAMSKEDIAKALSDIAAEVAWHRYTETTETVASGECGNSLTWKLGDNGVLTVSGDGRMTEYNSGEAPWTEYKNVIFSVVIEEGVTTVGRTAFINFENLVNVSLPESLVKISGYAFYGCTSLGTVTVPEGVREIGVYAFRKSGLTDVILTDVYGWSTNGVAIGSYELTPVYAAEYLTATRAGYAWVKDTNAGEEDFDPNLKMGGVAGKLNWTLSYDGILTVSGNGSMPDYSAGKAPWARYATEVKTIVVSDGVTGIGRCAFYGFGAVTAVELPDTLTDIDSYAFYGCALLTDVTVPASVNSIAPFAFRKTGLIRATFTNINGWSVDGETVPTYELIGTTAAAYLTKLCYGNAWTRDTSASSEPSDPSLIAGGKAGVLEWRLSVDGILTVSGDGEMPAFSSNGMPWVDYRDNVTSLVISEGVTTIGYCAFYGFNKLETLTLPSTLVDIGAYAFYGCSALSEAIIPESLESIGIYAFRKTAIARAVFVNPIDWKHGESWFEDGLITDTASAAAALRIGNYKDKWTRVDRSTADIEIFLDGKPFEDFSADKSEYSLNIDINTEDFATVTVIAGSEAQTVTVTQASLANGGVATVTVVNGHGTVEKNYVITFVLTGDMNINNAVVNKNGADATVTYVVDDGNKETATFAKNMMDKYDYLTFSFAVWTKDFATLTEIEGEDGKKEYLMDEDGKYVYTQTDDQLKNVQFWVDVLTGRDCELVSHSMTHSFWGTNDDGGTFEYLKSNDTQTVLSATVPKGSSTKELYASKQIIEDLFPSYLSPKGCVGFIIPGISVYTKDIEVDGKLIPTYNTYFNQILTEAIEKGVYTSARTTFSKLSSSQVIHASELKTTQARKSIPGYMITEALNGGENWAKYIDYAIAENGWACYCIHNMYPNDRSGHYILQEKAEAMFAHTADKNVWVATFTDASTYYIEWSTATVTTSYESGKITVTLTDEEDDEIFSDALTVKVSVPSIWDTATVNGTALEIHKAADGSSFVYVNIVPDTGAIDIIGA